MDKGKLLTRVGYGASDMACNLVWTILTMYLMFFYTDIYGLAAAQVSVLFLLTRCVDAVTDVIMGMIIDKTNTKWGKSRPYFLLGAIPFALLAILTFHVPDLGDAGKLVYAYITYTGLSCAYTLVNIPISSILPSITEDGHERTVLVSFRMVFAAIGATLVSVTILPLVNFFGQGDNAQGIFYSVILFSVIAVFLFFFTFKTVEEKVQYKTQKVQFKTSAKSCVKNKAYLLCTLNFIPNLGASVLSSGALIYYFTYNVGNAALVGIIASFTSFLPVVASILSPKLTTKFTKQQLMQYGGVGQILGYIIIAISINNIVGILIGAALSAFCTGIRNNMSYAMTPDQIDYALYTDNVNVAGLATAGRGFMGKFTLALAGSLTGVLLSLGGYVPNAEQTPQALFAIKSAYLYIPILLIVVSMAMMHFYDLDKKMPEITAALIKRRESEEK